MNQPPQTEQPKVPLRGLAMILIAVAILLAAWGLYFMFQGKDAKDTTQAQATTSAQPQAEQAAPAPATVEAPAAEEPVRLVHVLNNSTIQGLAATIGDQLGQAGYQVGEVGNFAESVLAQNTVFFTPENPAEEQAAQELAAKVGGVAVPRDPALPQETNTPGSIVLVLVTQTQVS